MESINLFETLNEMNNFEKPYNYLFLCKENNMLYSNKKESHKPYIELFINNNFDFEYNFLESNYNVCDDIHFPIECDYLTLNDEILTDEYITLEPNKEYSLKYFIKDGAYYIHNITMPKFLGCSDYDCSSPDYYSFFNFPYYGIKIPKEIKTIDANAFKPVYPLSIFTIHKNNFINNSSLNAEENNYWGAMVYDTLTECGLYIRNNTIISCKSDKESVVIPNSVTSIGDGAFYNCPLSSVTFEEGSQLQSIGNNAFRGCNSLTSIEIPSSVTSIGDSAFEYCSKLTSINIPSGVTSIGDSAFTECYSLSSIEIPSSVTSIGDSAFHGCSKLTSINIPSGVTSIGDSAFGGCYKLTSINIPSGVTSIGDSAFQTCSSLTSITIPSGVTSIGDSAFSNCSILTSITFEEGSQLNSIGKYAFGSCTSLTSIEIPNSVTSIGDGAFYECRSLSSIVIPSGVTSIGYSAFYECRSLSSIVIPSGVTSIGDSAFGGCTSLSSIDIPNGVTEIGNYTFQICSSLSSITIPNSVKSIGSRAFHACTSLSSITIPNSVTSIGDSAFRECNSLSEIICLATKAPTIQSYTFKDICKNGVLYYPQGSTYSSWLSTSNYYLGKYGWASVALQ